MFAVSSPDEFLLVTVIGLLRAAQCLT